MYLHGYAILTNHSIISGLIAMLPLAKSVLSTNIYRAYLIFVAEAVHIVRGEIFVMWRNFKCGVTLDVEKLYMLGNLRSGEKMDVEKF